MASECARQMFHTVFCVVLFSRRLLRDVALPSCQGIRPGLFRVPVWFLPLNPGAETFRAVRVTLVLGRSVWCDCAPREGWLRARVSSVVLFSFSLALGTLDSRGRYLVLGYLLRCFSALSVTFLRVVYPHATVRRRGSPSCPRRQDGASTESASPQIFARGRGFSIFGGWKSFR